MLTLDGSAPDLDELPDAVLVLTADGTVSGCNTAALRLLAGDRPPLGRPVTEVAALRDDAGREWWACTAPLRGWSRVRGMPERLLELEGHPVFATATYVRDPERRALLRVVLSLRPASARERAERGRAELVSTVAHELRSPLTSVKGFTATLLAKWERFTDEQKRVMLATVNSDADRVTRLLTELLDVSRIDTGRLEVRRQVVDLQRSVQRAIDSRVASGEDLERFRLDVSGPLPEMWLDPDKVAQVVDNLVENALRHGEGRVLVQLEPLAEPSGARLTVRDEGEGVPEDIRDRIFTKFFRGRLRRGGTGLGLYIVRGVVEAHGGTIRVAEAPGGGAEFVVTLPAGQPSYLL